MKMVAAAKLRRAQESAEQSKPYAASINKLLQDLVAQGVGSEHPLLKSREVKKRLVVVFSSDRGLCGAFNSNLLRKVERDLIESPVPTELVLIGKKANSYFARKSFPIWKKIDAFWTNFSHASSSALAQELLDAFTTGTFDQVDLFYNEFISIMSQIPKIETFAPIMTGKSTKVEAVESAGAAPIFEPNKEAILKALLPKAVEVRFYQPCLQSLASEFGARMAAMDSATRNAGEMIDGLTLTMNRVRQANITRELVEIISGAEAVN